jgi:hypothetical protein
MSKEIKWHPADGLISRWGSGMVVADIEIDKNHTLSIFCDAEQKQKVDRMFGKREWVGLTEKEIEDCCKQGGIGLAIQMLKEKNT